MKKKTKDQFLEEMNDLINESKQIEKDLDIMLKNYDTKVKKLKKLFDQYKKQYPDS